MADQNTGNAAAMLKRLRARKQDGDQGATLVHEDEQPIGSDAFGQTEQDQQLEQAQQDERLASVDGSDQGVEGQTDDEQPVSSDSQPASDLIAQVNGASADGDADTAPVIDVPVAAQGDPVVQRMLAQLQKMQAKTAAVTQRIEKRATKVVAKAEKASTPRVAKASKAKRQPESVAEMFPRFPTMLKVWDLIVAGQTAGAEGAAPTIVLSINAIAKQLDATRPTVKNAVHALKKEGILVDTTPDLNAAHTYEVHAPDFSEAIKANAALPADAAPASTPDEGEHETSADDSAE